MKTEIEVKGDVYQSEIKAGDVGYIDGYVVGGDGRPYVCVVIPSKGIVDLVPSNLLKVIHNETHRQNNRSNRHSNRYR